MGVEYLQNLQRLVNTATDMLNKEDNGYTESLIDDAYDEWFKNNEENISQTEDFETLLRKAFTAGFKLVDEAWGQQEGVGYSHYN
jgi:hypothetical protein